jgi:hypothetical protein
VYSPQAIKNARSLYRYLEQPHQTQRPLLRLDSHCNKPKFTTPKTPNPTNSMPSTGTARPSTFGGCCTCNKENIDERKCTIKPRRRCGHIVACCQAYAGNSRRDESTILEEPVYPSHVPMDTFYHYRVIPKG